MVRSYVIVTATELTHIDKSSTMEYMHKAPDQKHWPKMKQYGHFLTLDYE